jgi:hypothetical protein
MRDYKSALEVLEPLDELDEDIVLDREYLEALELLSNHKMEEAQKVEKLLEIYSKNYHLTYLIFEYLFRVAPQKAWENLNLSKSEVMTEIFWRCDAQNLDLDIISKNSFLRDLFSARGILDLSSKSDIFEFDLLIKLQNRANATLSFEYICNECKSVAPFAFSRCSN